VGLVLEDGREEIRQSFDIADNRKTNADAEVVTGDAGPLTAVRVKIVWLC
jgi:hypothetical protein